MKTVIRLTESQLNEIVKKSVREVLLNEGLFGFGVKKIRDDAKLMGIINDVRKKWEAIKDNVCYCRDNKERYNTIMDFEKKLKSADIGKTDEKDVVRFINESPLMIKKIEKWVSEDRSRSFAKSEQERKNNASSYHSKPKGSSYDNYDDDSGIAHFGNGDAYRA